MSTKQIFSQSDSNSILNDITPKIIMTTPSIDALAIKLSPQTVRIIESLQTPKKMIAFMERQQETQDLTTVSFMIFYGKPQGSKRGTRGFLFLSSTKELTIFKMTNGIDEKYGKVTSVQTFPTKQKISFHLNDGSQCIFKLKYEKLSNTIYDAVTDFCTDCLRPFRDCVISFTNIPSEKLEINPLLKESFIKMIVTIDLEFISRVQTFQFDEQQANELGEILFTLFSKYNSLVFATSRLISISFESTKLPNLLFAQPSVFTGIMFKWLNTSCFDIYERLAESLKNSYKTIFGQDESHDGTESTSNFDKIIHYYQDFINVINPKEHIPKALLNVAYQIRKQALKYYPDNENLPHILIIQVFFKMGLQKVIGGTPEYQLINDFIEFNVKTDDLNQSQIQTLTSYYDQLKSSLIEATKEETQNPNLLEMSTQETNKQFVNMMRFLLQNAQSLYDHFNGEKIESSISPIEAFLNDLFEATRRLRLSPH